MKKVTTYILILFFFCMCSQNKPTSFFYEYLEEINVSLRIENGVYLFIPLDSCDACLNEIMTLLSENKLKNTKKICLIVVGSSLKEMDRFKQSFSNYQVFKDIKLISIKKGIIDGHYPYLYEIKNFKILNDFEINIFNNFDTAKNILLKNYI